MADAQRQRQLALGQQPVARLQLARQQAVAKEGEDPRRAALRLVAFGAKNIQNRCIGHLVSPWSDLFSLLLRRLQAPLSRRFSGPTRCERII
jgi:hypothetical protein